MAYHSSPCLQARCKACVDRACSCWCHDKAKEEKAKESARKQLGNKESKRGSKRGQK